MSFLDDTMGDFQHQAEVMGQNAAQGAITTAQQALPGFLDLAGQFAQGQLQTAATTVAPAARDLGREAGKGAREGIGDLGTTEKVLLGAGGVALLSLVGFAVYKASRPSRAALAKKGF